MLRRCSMGQGGAIIHHIVKAVVKDRIVDEWTNFYFKPE